MMAVSIDRLRETELFEGMEPDDVQAIGALASPLQTRRGARIFTQGAPATKGYLLLEGLVRLTHTTGAGQRVTIMYIRRGEAFGHGRSFGVPIYLTAAEVVEESQLLEWEYDQGELLVQYPRLARNAGRILARYLDLLVMRLVDTATMPARARLARAVLTLSSLPGWTGKDPAPVVRLSQEQIAEYAGTTLYTASRILNEWKRHGFVATGRMRLRVTNPQALARIPR